MNNIIFYDSLCYLGLSTEESWRIIRRRRLDQNQVKSYGAKNDQLYSGSKIEFQKN